MPYVQKSRVRQLTYNQRISANQRADTRARSAKPAGNAMTLATVEPTVRRHTRRFWNEKRAESKKPSTRDLGWKGRNGRSLGGRSGRKSKTAGGSNSGKLGFGRERWLSVPTVRLLIGGFEIDRTHYIKRFPSQWARVSNFGLQTISTLDYLGRYINQHNSLRSISAFSHVSSDPRSPGNLAQGSTHAIEYT